MMVVQGQAQHIGKERDSRSLLHFEISPIAETTPVESPEDAADDVCIYVPTSVTESVIVVGTNKKKGLDTYSLRGERLHSYSFGRLNNVDLINGAYPIIIGSNRTFNSVDFYRLFADGSLQLLYRKPTGLKDVYGLSADFHPDYGYMVFVSDKKGRVQEYTLEMKSASITATLNRTFKFSSVVEGMDVDLHNAALYAAEENKGLWKLDLKSDTSRKNRKLLLSVDKENIKADLEGVAIARLDASSGLVFVSVQGSNSYALLDLASDEILGTFAIKATYNNALGSVEETDGIDVSTHLRARVFIAQDGINEGLNQNFKMVSFDQLLTSIFNRNFQ